MIDGSHNNTPQNWNPIIPPNPDLTISFTSPFMNNHVDTHGPVGDTNNPTYPYTP